MGVLQVNIKGHVGKNTGVPWLHYRKERGNRIADGDGGAWGSGRVERYFQLVFRPRLSAALQGGYRAFRG